MGHGRIAPEVRYVLGPPGHASIPSACSALLQRTGDVRALRQGRQLRIDDVAIDRAEPGAGTEAAVTAGDDAVGADNIGIARCAAPPGAGRCPCQ